MLNDFVLKLLVAQIHKHKYICYSKMIIAATYNICVYWENMIRIRINSRLSFKLTFKKSVAIF